jgi:hypothetical protein
MRSTSALAAAPLLALLAAAVEAAPAPSGPGGWRQAALWDDGNAELCAYEVTWPRYGQLFPGRALLVLVKEPWAPDLDVKADTPRRDGFDVLKLNHVRDVATGIYTYHQMASIYFRRADAGLEKVAASSAEACGVSTAHWAGGKLALHSYFDGVGDRRLRWPRGALPEDGLPALLRDWVSEAEPPPELVVLPSLLDSRLADVGARALRLTRQDAGTVEVPGGRFDAVELRLEGRGGETDTQRYVFERAAPHRLLELRRGDGTVYRMARCDRLRYWEMHDPGGERWLPPSVR